VYNGLWYTGVEIRGFISGELIGWMDNQSVNQLQLISFYLITFTLAAWHK